VGEGLFLLQRSQKVKKDTKKRLRGEKKEGLSVGELAFQRHFGKERKGERDEKLIVTLPMQKTVPAVKISKS